MMPQRPVAEWSELELIAQVMHQLRQSSAATSGFVNVLQQQMQQYDMHMFDQSLAALERAAASTAEVVQWLHLWGQARKTQADAAERAPQQSEND